MGRFDGGSGIFGMVDGAIVVCVVRRDMNVSNVIYRFFCFGLVWFLVYGIELYMFRVFFFFFWKYVVVYF